jgi:Schlafen, AlbA_2
MRLLYGWSKQNNRVAIKLRRSLSRSATDPKAIMSALKNLHDDMIKTAHYAKTEDRVKNIDKTTGLIQKYFVHKEPPALQHGPGLALDFENSLRRSSIETSRYEFKQGILRLSPERALDVDLFPRLIQTICAIANVGPDAPGFIYVGVADKEADGQKIELLDKVTPLRVGQRFVVGIDREVKILKVKTDDYIQKIITAIRASVLSEPLKTQVLTRIDVVTYRELTIIRIKIPTQNEVSFVGNDSFVRQNSGTIKVEGKVLLALNALFQKQGQDAFLKG